MKTISKRIKIAVLTALIAAPLLFVSTTILGRAGAEARIDQDYCIGCGTCVDILPEFIELNEDGKAQFKVDIIPAGYVELLILCVASCPEQAISIVGTSD